MAAGASDRESWAWLSGDWAWFHCEMIWIPSNMHIVNRLTLGRPPGLNTDVILSQHWHTLGLSLPLSSHISVDTLLKTRIIIYCCPLYVLGWEKTSWLKLHWSQLCEPLKSVESNGLLSEISRGLSTNCEGSWLRHCNFYIFLMGWIQQYNCLYRPLPADCPDPVSGWTFIIAS